MVVVILFKFFKVGSIYINVLIMFLMDLEGCLIELFLIYVFVSEEILLIIDL